MGLVDQRRRDGGMLPLASVSDSTAPIPLNDDLENPAETTRWSDGAAAAHRRRLNS